MSLQFCSECNNMLYPKENRAQKKLYYFCRGCSHEEDAKEAIIYRNELLHETEDKAVVVQEVSADPTLPRTNTRCPKCGHTEACYFQSSSRPEEAMTLYFVCASPDCGNRWKAVPSKRN